MITPLLRQSPRPQAKRAKWALRYAAALLGVLVIGVSLILEVSAALSRATERDVTYRYIDEALPALDSAPSINQWQTPLAPLNRPLGQGDLARVDQTLTDAWRAHAGAMSSGRGDVLADYFSGVALERATQATTVTGAHMVVLSQDLRPIYFHSDASVLQLTGTALTVRFRLTEAGDLELFQIAQDGNLTTLLNETDGWRIFSHERRTSSALPPRAPVAVPERLAGINYYPAETPWSAFWPAFDLDLIRSDFDLISDLEANAVRIFLPRATFLDDETASTALSDLAALLDEAESRGLAVIPTLFDMRGDYGVATWANDAAYLSRVLPVLAASSAVAYVDLKNEPDLDFAGQGHGLVEAWARSMLAVAHQIAPGLAYTIGWSASEAATLLADRLDVVSYHDYADPEDSAARLAAVQASAAGRPVHITEIGETAYTLALGFPASPQAQADRLSARLSVLSDAEGVFVWTLHDFPAPDSSAIGHSPWVRRLQAQFGLFAPDGAPKPAARAVQSAFLEHLTSHEGASQ
jgi:hypothetical protein